VRPSDFLWESVSVDCCLGGGREGKIGKCAQFVDGCLEVSPWGGLPAATVLFAAVDSILLGVSSAKE
jgi:hypothetical protein